MLGWNSSVLHQGEKMFTGMTCSLKDLRKKHWGLKHFVREQGSSQTAQCHQQLPPALPPQVSWTSLHIPAQKTLWALSPLCANLCEQSLGTVQGLQTAQLSPAHLNRFMCTAPQKTPAEGSSCLEMSALAVPGGKSFSQKKKPKGQSPNPPLRWWQGDALWHSLWQRMCVTQGAGATEAFLKWYNMSKIVVCHLSAHKTRELGNVTIFVQMVLSGFQSLLPGSESTCSVNGWWRFLKSRFHQTMSGDR